MPNGLSPPLPLTRLYRRARLGVISADPTALVDDRPIVESQELLPSSVLDVPPLEYGETDMSKHGIELQHPLNDPGMSRLDRHGPTRAFLLRDAMVHFKYGVITLGERVVEETLYHFPIHNVLAASWNGENHLRLPELPVSASLDTAYHLLACNQDNYYHWMIDLVTRFRTTQYEVLKLDSATTSTPILVLPPLDTFWKRETISHSVSSQIPRLFLVGRGRLFVKRLLYVPDLSGGAFNPHPAILDSFDAIRTKVMGDGPMPPPWRRLYISRADSGSRVLINEAEIMERAVRAGFTPVVLGKLSTAEQVRIFAEASHILAPHGAGLTNIGFCQRGVRLCELQMNCYVHWAFRVLAALRGVRYGCLIGARIGERHAWAHNNSWYLDPKALDSVLDDPRFTTPD
jgi:hypothetical protein